MRPNTQEQTLAYNENMPALTWRPDAWRSFSNNPTAFMDAFRQLKKPTSNLHGDTYLKCATQGYRVLEKYPQYHAEYFEGLTAKMPPSAGTSPDRYTLQYTLNFVESKYARIESLLWHNAITFQWDRKREDLFHWVLTLQRRYDEYDVLLQPQAPAWARAYVEIQRDGYSNTWSSWYHNEPLNQILPILTALARSHIACNKEDPVWLRQAMSCVYERLRDEPTSRQLLVSETTDFLDLGLRAGGHACAIVDWVCESSDQSIMSNDNLLARLWYGQRLHSTPEGVARFQTFWDSLQPVDRGRVLSTWYSAKSAWHALDSRTEAKALLTILTSKPVEFPVIGQDMGLEFVRNSPSATPKLLEFITGILPFTHPILDMIGPDDFLAYTIAHWSTLRSTPTSIELDSLVIKT